MPKTDDAIRLACADPVLWWERLLSDMTYEPVTGCRLWAGGVNRAGYGRLTLPVKRGHWASVFVHRLSYALYHGFDSLPPGVTNAQLHDVVIDHSCNNPRCFNPEHLRRMAHGRNLARGRWARARRLSGSAAG